MNKIKVFIIDDSSLMRQTIKRMLEPYADVEILGEAPNPVDAFDVFEKVGLPDLFILDVEMPKMDGITFLKLIKEQNPTPTIIFSAVVAEGSANAVRALALGACDVISKPSSQAVYESEDYVEEFIDKIRACSAAKLMRLADHSSPVRTTPLKPTNKIVAIGASTGGVQSLSATLPSLEPNHAPIVITQHMPEGFTASFSKQLNELCFNSRVKEAQTGDILQHGRILVAPGAMHLEVRSMGNGRYKAVLKDYPKVSSHKPSVDVLFTSMAKEVGPNSVAVILTGMGRDGALGMKKIKEAGGKTYGQDEATSVVYGMPKVAFEMGVVDRQIPLEALPGVINTIR